MASVGDTLRRDQRASDVDRAPAARVEMAFELGEADLALFAAGRGLARDDALRLLRARRQAGRRPSGCLAGREP